MKNWSFLAVVYPCKQGETLMQIERLDDATVRVGTDTLCFEPKSQHAAGATVVIDTKAFVPRGEKAR